MDRDALIALAAREIAEAIPGARGAVLRRGTVIREKRATFSLAPGQPPRPGVTDPVDGLFLAGDWIDTGLPGTIESAARAGHMAARACLDRSPAQPARRDPHVRRIDPYACGTIDVSCATSQTRS